ncbi:MAG: hypothetical protein KA754_07405 [Corallincola sp.]|nr:hypothetical protein [Corallincola sp.]
MTSTTTKLILVILVLGAISNLLSGPAGWVLLGLTATGAILFYPSQVMALINTLIGLALLSLALKYWFISLPALAVYGLVRAARNTPPRTPEAVPSTSTEVVPPPSGRALPPPE